MQETNLSDNSPLNESDGPAFTIAVMTYNRGRRVLEMATMLLPQLDDNWELMILDNASTEEADSYAKLNELAQQDHRLNYVRHEVNTFAQGNFLKALELSKSDFVMILSDEDYANPTMIRQILPALSLPNLGIIRGGIAPVEGMKPRNSHPRPDQSYFAGAEALTNFTFTNNYFSGTIYNTRLIKEYGLLDAFRQGLSRNRVYPHLYLELLMCAKCDVISTSEIACFEGYEQHIEESGDPLFGKTKGPSEYAAPYSFGSRVDQFIILRDAIREAVSLIGEPFDTTLFVLMYLRLCEKYFYLITQVNSPMYISHQVHPGLLHQAMLYICGASISMYPEIQHCDTQIFAEIQKIHQRYELHGNS